MSLFVAVILDNLELDEDAKKVPINSITKIQNPTPKSPSLYVTSIIHDNWCITGETTETAWGIIWYQRRSAAKITSLWKVSRKTTYDKVGRQQDSVRYSNKIFPHLPFNSNSKSYYIQKNLILDFIESLPISQHPRYGIVSFLSLSTRQKTLTMMTKIQMLESAPPPLPFPWEVGYWEIIYLVMQKRGE